MSADVLTSARLRSFAVNLIVTAGALLLLLPGRAGAGGVVSACTEADFRAALVGGGLVTFACDGTLTLSNTIEISADTVLDGAGHAVTVSGGGLVRVLYINPGVNLSLLSLGIVNGASPAGGGAVYVAGQLSATNCAFNDNRATAGAGLAGCGGAIYNAGALRLSQCGFWRNRCVGGSGNHGSDGSPFTRAGTGGPGAAGCGGAIYNAGSALIDRSLFASNQAVGGPGGLGGNGTLVVGFSSDQTGGRGGDGGVGEGAALFNVSTARVVNCTLAGNLASGGQGGQGGWGGMYTLNPHGSAVNFPGGDGGRGGDAWGAVFHSAGELILVNDTLGRNSAAGGAGGPAGTGSGSGSVGPAGSAWVAGIQGAASLVNTLLAGNTPGGNGAPMLIDRGHNLSSDATCAFTNAGSFNHIDPFLSPLADNGGPTLTMALSSGSPAIDVGDTAAAPAMDQRGAPRPVGSAADIGACEYGWPAALRLCPARDQGLELLACGVAGQSFCLLASTNLTHWTPQSTNQMDVDGTALFHVDPAPGDVRRFYRLALP